MVKVRDLARFIPLILNLIILILVKLITVLIIYLTLHKETTLAGGRTQVNQVTDFFDKNINDKAQVDKFTRDQKDASVNNIKVNNVLGELPGGSEVNKVTSELSNIDAGSLESRARASNEYNEFNKGTPNTGSKYLIDHNSNEVASHKKNVDEIANATNVLMQRLTAALREQGLDCHEVAANRELNPQWFIDLEKTSEKEVVHDRYYCEHLMNNYSCFDDLTVQCLEFAERGADFSVNGTNMRYQQTSLSPIKRFSFEANYGGDGGANRYGGGRAHGFMNKASGSTYNAQQAGWYVNFNVGTILSTVNRVELTNLQYGTFVMIKLNGAVLVVGPIGGNNLYLNGHHAVITEGKKKYGGKFGKRATITTNYPKVNTGYAEHILGLNPIANNSGYGTINLMPYIRQGGNSLEVVAISMGPNRVIFNLDVSERICLNWQESWHEKCGLNITEP